MDQLQQFFSLSQINGWDVLFALITIVVGWITAALAKRAVLALGKRWEHINPTLVGALARGVKYLIWLVAIGLALAFLGANVQPLLVTVIVVGAVAVLALRGLATNFGAGIVLQSRRPFQIGDELEFEDLVGKVTELNSRSVVMTTTDGRTVHIPNGKLLDDAFSNNSAHGARRTDLAVRVQARLPRQELVELIHGALERVDTVHKRPKPRVLFTEISAERYSAIVEVWHAPQSRRVALSDAVTAMADALAERELAGTVQSASAPPPLVPPPAV